MSVAAPEKKKPMLPPDERFWQRYSPRHEFPLAGVTSIFAHCFIVGIVALAAFLLMLRRESESQRPPNMDVVLAAEGGPGGGEPGSRGDKLDNTEITDKPKMGEASENLPPPNDTKLLDAPKVELDVPSLVPVPIDQSVDISKQLNELLTQAKKSATEPKSPPTKSPGGVKNGIGKNPGGANPNGVNGPGGPGPGGPGGGGGATKQQIYAQRWRFDLAGGPKEHAAKLTAVGVTLGFFERNNINHFMVVQDLTKRPVHARRDSDKKYFGVVVIWSNNKQESVQALARELQLPHAPSAVFMMLPKDREEKMAEVEAAYARAQGRDPNRITETWFDFRLQDGSFEPFVIRQQ
ncbi:MAG: hypothetical protein HY040_16250 [Planctomycetes bacterium]|nr:hypothetical protein [Planctomycetota bacterium]